VAIDAADYQRLTGDTRVNDLALWLAPGADAGRGAGGAAAPGRPTRDAGLRRHHRRSCARCRCASSTAASPSPYYLQAVAIAVGLVGVAASLSAQVLARRKEFGLLAHLGLTRRQVIGWWPARPPPGWPPAR
jgi:putative ABC transport system permease protein